MKRIILFMTMMVEVLTAHADNYIYLTFETMDVAKWLLDYGYHAPTIYFPLLFHESLMIEPTENESKDTIDAFIAVMRKIAEEAKTDPELVKSAPHHTPIGLVDDVLAAKHPITTYKQMINDNN